MIEIAVESCTVQLTWQGGGNGPPPTLSFSQISTPPSTKVKAEGKGVYSGDITVMGNASQTADMQPAAPVPVTVTISPMKITSTKAENKTCIGKGDTGMSSATYSWTAPPPPAGSGIMYTGTVKAEITDAGQTKVVAQ